MATQTYEQLIAGANKIKENELPESNSNSLVGDQLFQMASKQQEEYSLRMKGTTEYNVSVQFPTGGVDGTNKYTLELAIAKVPAELRSIGLKCSFLNEAGKPETWEWQGGTFAINGNWSQIDASYINLQISETVGQTNFFRSSNQIEQKYLAFFKEIYITGNIIPGKIYYLRLVVNNKDGSSAIFLAECDMNFSNSKIVCTVNGLKKETRNGVITINQYGNSGITAKAIVNWNVFPDGINTGEILRMVFNEKAFNLYCNPTFFTLAETDKLQKYDARLQNHIDHLFLDTDMSMYERVIINKGRLNAYAYTGEKKFITNEYTANSYYTLFELKANVRYRLTQQTFSEAVGVYVGYIENESDFILGGTIESVVMNGGSKDIPLKTVIVNNEKSRLLVLLGNKDSIFSRVVLEELTIKHPINKEVEKLQNIIGANTKLCCPDKYYAVVGEEFNLYYDTLIKAMDAGLQSPLGVYIDIQCPDLQNASNQIGTRRERMWQIDASKLTSLYIGEHTLQISAYDLYGNLLDKKNAVLKIVASSPLTTQKYILCIGASATNNGPIVSTCAQHFIDIGGVQPIFIGQRTSFGYKHEGYPGYTFGSFVSGTTAYAYSIFDTPEGTSVSSNDQYSTNGTTYKIMDIRTEGLDSKIRIRCERVSGTNEPTSSGILTKVSGASSSEQTIAYSAYEAESGNPFWNEETKKNDFTKYRTKMGMGANKFDAVFILLGTNDCIGNIKPSMQSSVDNAKVLIDSILADAGSYPTKILLQMTLQDANTVSSWQVYSDILGSGRKIGYWTNLWNLRQLLYDEFSKPEWSGKVILGSASLGCDRYYGFPYVTVKSSARLNSIDEIYHTNSVHPNTQGYQQIGDGYFLQAKAML